ncbi:MAG: hypothetical protein LBI13_03520 [Streptococcaceae bacterium]|jgi:hypothetical protein|nr:hypothetical protein [Streptococcaceae bacterium]
MVFFRRKKTKENEKKFEEVASNQEGWEELPAYILADAKDIKTVSIIASSLLAGDYPESKFTVKKIWQRNPEVELVSVIATALTARENTSSVKVTKISKKLAN